jgi:DNA-binding LacI/PurR family transcriptional regulator
MSRLKMADIARLADVSVSTVSRALAGSPRVPDALRKKIEAIAESQGYVVNRAASNLRLQRTQTIGLVLPMGHETGQQLTDPFLLEIIGFLSEEVIKRDYDIHLTRVKAPGEGWLKALIQSHRFDGMLMLGQSDQHAAINDVAQRYREMVVWGERLPDQLYCSVGVDNVSAGRMATEHLIGLGRKTIRFMGPPRVPEVDSRYRGYLDAMDASPLRGATDLIEARFTYDSAYEATRKLLRGRVRFDALFAASDVIAHGAMTAIAEAGLSVPADIAVVGFDDVAMARSLNPPLTTIRQDLPLAASLMVDLLFKRMSGEMTSSAQIPASLVVRGSSGAL